MKIQMREKTRDIAKRRSDPGAPSASNAVPVSRSEYIQSLERGLAIIMAFGDKHPRMTLSEVARSVGFTRPATRRFLLTLQSLGYARSDGKYFELQPKLLELGYAYLASQPWWRMSQQVADRLATKVDLAVAVGVMDRDAALYVAHAKPDRFSTLGRSVGTRLPAFASAIGRVLLAHQDKLGRNAYVRNTKLTRLTQRTITDPKQFTAMLNEICTTGYALIDQELEIGLRTMAVPIFDRGGQVPAAIGVSVLDAAMSTEVMVGKFLLALQAAAKEISSGMPM